MMPVDGMSDAIPASLWRRLLSRRVPTGALLQVAIGWLACDTLLLCRFIGLDAPWVVASWLILAAALLRLLALPPSRSDPTVATLLCCVGVAFILMLLGGQGRFFYANIDWQVRDAVLRDMWANPWPFIYASGNMLRAPLGMYLFPATIGKAYGQAGADLALLAQNSALLGLILAIGSSVFEDRRSRLVALATLLLFGGLDVVGQLIAGNLRAISPTAHLEGWGPTQFSSTITLAFWVPQHAIAGWLAAVGYMLWKTGRLRLGALLALPPLLASWSPLPCIGMIPFVAYAVWRDLAVRRIGAADMAAPVIAAAIALPSLAYMSAAGDRVGMRIYEMRPEFFLLFAAIELVPFIAMAVGGWRGRFGGPTLAITTSTLIVLPWLQIGSSTDLAMRGSIPALTILACHLSEALSGGWAASLRRKAALLLLLAISGVTGVTEVLRALTYPVSPPPRCDVASAWDVTFSAFPKDSYLAPYDRIPALIRPAAPASAAYTGSGPCFDRDWARPPFF